MERVGPTSVTNTSLLGTLGHLKERFKTLDFVGDFATGIDDPNSIYDLDSLKIGNGVIEPEALIRYETSANEFIRGIGFKFKPLGEDEELMRMLSNLNDDETNCSNPGLTRADLDSAISILGEMNREVNDSTFREDVNELKKRIREMGRGC